jgi:hypothetical protein
MTIYKISQQRQGGVREVRRVPKHSKNRITNKNTLGSRLPEAQYSVPLNPPPELNQRQWLGQSSALTVSAGISLERRICARGCCDRKHLRLSDQCQRGKRQLLLSHQEAEVRDSRKRGPWHIRIYYHLDCATVLDPTSDVATWLKTGLA